MIKQKKISGLAIVRPSRDHWKLWVSFDRKAGEQSCPCPFEVNNEKDGT
jgi:hypothetical protein